MSDLQTILMELKSMRAETKVEFCKIREEAKADNLGISKKIDLINTSIKDSNVKIDKMCKKINEHQMRIESLETKIDKMESLEFEMGNMNLEIVRKFDEKDKEIQNLKNQIDSIEIDKRKNNIIVSGLPEKPGEDRNKLSKDLHNIIKELLGIDINILPHQVFRRGENRRIILKLESSQIKTNILQNAYKLKGTNIFISHDFTIRQETARYHLRNFIKLKGKDSAKFKSNFSVEYADNVYHYNDNKSRVEIKA